MVQTPDGLERFAGSNALLAIASALGADNNSAATDLRGSVAILVQLLDSEAILTSNVSALLSACPNGSETHLQEQTAADVRSEEHTSELQSLMRISYSVF